MNDGTSSGENANEDAHIRALLAELGSGPDGRPIPPAVAARLDDTLARLVAERGSADEHTESGEDTTGDVLPLRRRWLSRATAAAAAVIVVGAGGVAAANLGVFGNGASMSSDSGAGAADSQVAESAPAATPASPRQGLTKDDAAREDARSAVALPRISASSFASDVSALLRRGAVADLAGEAPSASPDTDGDTTEKSPPLETPGADERTQGNALRSTSCTGPQITDGAVPNPIRYDGKLAVLVIHPESDGQQLVEAWTCTGDRRLAETTITP